MMRKGLIAVMVVLVVFLALRFFKSDEYSSDYKSYAELEKTQNIFVGDQACQKCHTVEYKKWQKSHHYMSMLPANDSTVKGNFNNVTITLDGITSRFYKKGKEFYINTEGADGKNHDFLVKYIFGFYPLQQYLIVFPGGRMQVPRLSWDSRDKKWFNQYPGQNIPSHDWLHWTGNAQNWNTMCAVCHSTNLQKNYDTKTDTYKTTYSVINVSCESCHGPGKNHISLVRSPNYNAADYKNKSHFVTKNTNQLEQINTCAPCHALITEISNTHIQSKELYDNYIPQIPSTENFHPDGQFENEDYNYTSFLQSKMYAKGVKCSDCHDPHSITLKRPGNLTCTQCHVASKYSVPSHTFHKNLSSQPTCVNCHMPSKKFMGNDIRHDHVFRVPRPDLSEKYGVPNACTSCHKDKSNSELAKAIQKWYGPKRAPHFAEDLIIGSKKELASESHLINLVNNPLVPPIVKATSLFYLGDIVTEKSLATLLNALSHKEAVVRYHALRSLSNFQQELWRDKVGPLLNDKVRAVRIAAADLFITIPYDQIPQEDKKSFDNAHKELRKHLRYQTDFSVGNVMFADYFLKLKDYDNAVAFYEKGLKKDGVMNYALLNLSTVYSIQGKNELAIESLHKAIKNDPKNDRIYYNLGLVYVEINKFDEAMQSFAKAVSLQSKNPRVYYNYGLLLNQKNKAKEAEAVLLKGIAISPASSELYYALTYVYLQSKNGIKAQQTVIKLKQLDPNNPSYQELFKTLGV